MTDSNIEYLLALSSVKGLGDILIKQLIEHFESVEAIFDAEPAEIQQIKKLGSTLASRIGKVTSELPMFQEKLEALRDQHIHVLSFKDTNYPARLKEFDDAPVILCRVGELTEINESCVAIVGTRKPTRDASQLARELSRELTSAGFTVVSGLAAGIDTCAHEGALACSGKTIAVMGTDVLTVYPAKNRRLAVDIQSNGCLLSEHPFPTSPTPQNLVNRNRIISGLSLATIVIEAGENSGTMHTARFAKKQRRQIFACKWEDYNGREGTHALIRNDAIPFTRSEIDKVVDELQKKIAKDTVNQTTVDRKSTHEQRDVWVQEELFGPAVSEKPTKDTNQETKQNQ